MPEMSKALIERRVSWRIDGFPISVPNNPFLMVILRIYSVQMKE